MLFSKSLKVQVKPWPEGAVVSVLDHASDFLDRQTGRQMDSRRWSRSTCTMLIAIPELILSDRPLLIRTMVASVKKEDYLQMSQTKCSGGCFAF